MPQEFTLNLSSADHIRSAQSQLEKQGVPRQQVDKVLSRFEWHADRSASEAGLKRTEITLRLPGTGDDTVARRNGHSFLVSIMRVWDGVGHLSEELNRRKEQLLEPIADRYQVSVTDKTDRAALDRELLKQNVSLDSLQKQGFHVRGDKNSNTLTFKRRASGSGKFRKFLSGHQQKIERGRELLKTVLSRTGTDSSSLIEGFSTVRKESIARKSIRFADRPTWQEIQEQLQQSGTSLEELARQGYHARATRDRQSGALTLTFKERHSDSPDWKKQLTGSQAKQDLGARILRQALDEALMPQSVTNKIKGVPLTKERANELYEALTTEQTLADRVEWPTSSLLTNSLLIDNNDLHPLDLSPNSTNNRKIAGTLSELRGLRFLIDKDSQLGRLSSAVEKYRSLYDDCYGGEPSDEEIADFVTRSVDGAGRFNPQYAKWEISELLGARLVRELLRIDVLNDDPAYEKGSPVEIAKARVQAVRELVEAGFGLGDVADFLKRHAGMSFPDVGYLQVLKAKETIDHNNLSDLKAIQRETSRVTETIDSLRDEQAEYQKELSALNESHEKLSAELSTASDYIEQARRELEKLDSDDPGSEYTDFRDLMGQTAYDNMVQERRSILEKSLREARESHQRNESDIELIGLDRTGVTGNLERITSDLEAATTLRDRLQSDADALVTQYEAMCDLIVQARDNSRARNRID